MKSNSASAASAAPEYLRLDGWSHEWKVVSAKTIPETTASRAISDYYHKEASNTLPRNNSDSSPTESVAFINRAYPHHHALILAARTSSSKLVSREFPKCITGYDDDGGKWNIPFTDIIASSTYQKHHLTALSAMTGLLVTRLTHPGCSVNAIKTKKKCADITNKYIHSALAAECIIGNRYYRHHIRSGHMSKYPVGLIATDAKSNLTAADITPEALCVTQNQLRESYNANIDRLMSMIEMFKRGFIGIDQIRSDPEFIRMMSAFWRTANQLLKMNECFENQPPAPSANDVRPNANAMSFEDIKCAKRVAIISKIAEPGVITPLLYHYDVVHLFDNKNQSYAYYVKVTKATWARLANDGSTGSFLAFAAIEPDMVTEHCAPRLGGPSSVFHGLSLKSYANYIPSSHPVFGELRVKHRCHIMRTADAVNTMISHHYAPISGMDRSFDRFGPTYAPLHDIVEYIRRNDIVIDYDRQFLATHPNCGKLISIREAEDEFNVRVWWSQIHGDDDEYDDDYDDYDRSGDDDDYDDDDYDDDDDDRSG